MRKTMFMITVTLLAACSSGNAIAPGSEKRPLPPPPGTPNSVVVTNNAFAPNALSTSAGSRVTWTWDSCRGGDAYGSGQQCAEHDVAFDDGITSGVLSNGNYVRTFTSPGTYPYHCRIHGTSMSGRVVVN
ncbi:MAG: plastocyanin/azurin family copper-binding protein [Gemmatimonadaceae bacterium]